MGDPKFRTPSASVVVVSLLVVALFAIVGWMLRRQREDLERLEARLARLSGPEDRVHTAEEISALHTQIERQSARLRSIEQAGPPPSDDPEAAALRRAGWQQELDALRAELEAVRQNPMGSALTFEAFQPVVLDGFEPIMLPAGRYNSAPSWSADQALGPPDTEGLGDFPTAWASQMPDGGIEWLEVRFGEAVVPDGVVIIESYHPGAVVKVEASGLGQGWRTIWSGSDPSTEEANELFVGFGGGFAVDAVRITLDTRLVEGWNEIDAVGLAVGEDTIWGSESSASSTFGGG